MIIRKKKLIITQIILFLIGFIIIYYTYYLTKKDNNQLISIEDKKKIDTKLKDSQDVEDGIFYNIKYSGIDLAGNRYILLAEEAINSKVKEELVDMKLIEVTFYFKDDTTLKVKSKEGIYNNKTLDMMFMGNVEAVYEDSKLTANKANYSNLNSFLTVSNNVVVTDKKGVLVADKLLFDIRKQSLNIESFNNNKINANIIK